MIYIHISYAKMDRRIQLHYCIIQEYSTNELFNVMDDYFLINPLQIN